MIMFVVLLSALLLVADAQNNAQRPPAPRLVTLPGRYRVNQGEAITLPCDVTNLGGRSVFWLKGDNLQSRELVIQIQGARRRPVPMRRYLQQVRSGKLSTQGTSLVISNLTPADTSTYTCTVAWAGQSVTHVLEVIDADEARRAVLEFFPANRSLSVAEGAAAVFACRAQRQPQPPVTWYREGTEARALRHGSVLRLENTRREDAGRYTCATNGEESQRQGATFILHVQYITVRTARERVVIRTEEDQRARLTCYVEGYPEVRVSWQHDRSRVTDGPRHRLITASGQYHLEIHHVTAEDLGEYRCYGTNGISMNAATVTLIATPGETSVLQANPTQDSHTYNVTWTVQSVAPLRLYVLEFRKEGAASNQWNTTTIGISNQPRGRTYLDSALLTLDPDSKYEIRVRSVTQDNVQGPDMTRPFTITTDAVSSTKISHLLRNSLPILSRLPALVRSVLP